MKSCYFILLAMWIVAMATGAHVTPAHAMPVTYEGAIYRLTETAESWTAAEAEAARDGGHLASIHSAAQEQFIIDTFLRGTVTPDVFWIGLYDPTQSDGSGARHLGDFVWSDGSRVDYTNWNTATGEPNNYNNVEYWTAINWHYAASGDGEPGLWNDMALNGSDSYSVAVNGPYYGIVEVPEPGSVAVLAAGVAILSLTRRLAKIRAQS